MRVPVSESDLHSGPIKQIAKALAKGWPLSLTYMQAADKVAVILGYRNFHDMQMQAVPAVSSRLSHSDIRKNVFLSLVEALPDKVLSEFPIGALLRSLPLHLLETVVDVSPVEKNLSRPGALGLLRALIDEAAKPDVQRQGKMFVVPMTKFVGREDIDMEEEEFGEMLNYLIQTPVRFQQGKDKWITFNILTVWSIEENDVVFEFSPHFMTFYAGKG